MGVTCQTLSLSTVINGNIIPTLAWNINAFNQVECASNPPIMNITITMPNGKTTSGKGKVTATMNGSGDYVCIGTGPRSESTIKMHFTSEFYLQYLYVAYVNEIKVIWGQFYSTTRPGLFFLGVNTFHVNVEIKCLLLVFLKICMVYGRLYYTGLDLRTS